LLTVSNTLLTSITIGRRDEAYANEVLDDVAEQLAKLLEELKGEKESFKKMGNRFEEKGFTTF
jgi:type I restriction enzyme R subunit